MILKDDPNIDDQIVGLRVMVACESNANGEPDFYFCKVNCRRAAYNAGEHYYIAEQKAEKEGYEGKMVSFDEHDSAGRAIVDHFVWESADVWWHWPTA